MYDAGAEIDLDRGDEAIIACHDAFLRAGDAYSIFIVDEVEQLGYDRRRDGFILDFLSRTPGSAEAIRAMSSIDSSRQHPPGFLLGVDETEYLTVSTRLSHVREDGVLQEVSAHDMLDVARVSGVRHGHFGQPVEILAGVSFGDDHIHVSIGLRSDIWYPWTFPFGTTEREYRDNRLLAGLNGGRFNRFVREVRDACLSVGGRWYAQDFGDNDEDGFIILDQPRPEA
ncbi:MAG: hypothetical protein WCA46_28810 [Actinocatenispora sp.]